MIDQEDEGDDDEDCNLGSQVDDEVNSQGLMDEYKLFGNDKRQLVQNTSSHHRPPLHTKDKEFATSNYKSSVNALTRSTGF